MFIINMDSLSMVGKSCKKVYREKFDNMVIKTGVARSTLGRFYSGENFYDIKLSSFIKIIQAHGLRLVAMKKETCDWLFTREG